MNKLKLNGKLVLTPAKSYDDRVLLESALKLDAAVVSNDYFRKFSKNLPWFNNETDSNPQVIYCKRNQNIKKLYRDWFGSTGCSKSSSFPKTLMVVKDRLLMKYCTRRSLHKHSVMRTVLNLLISIVEHKLKSSRLHSVAKWIFRLLFAYKFTRTIFFALELLKKNLKMNKYLTESFWLLENCLRAV